MFHLSQIILLAYNIVTAAIHAGKFSKDKTVKHGWWGLYYAIIAGAMCYSQYRLDTERSAWLLAAAAICIRMVSFNIALNRFNRRHPFFVSTETKSWIDKAHYFIFRKQMWIWVILYTAGWVVVNIKR